jgi:hypothetical protein
MTAFGAKRAFDTMLDSLAGVQIDTLIVPRRVAKSTRSDMMGRSTG